MSASLFVIYPPPADPALFDRQYANDHLPLAAKNLTGVTKVVTHAVVGTPSGPSPYYRITEVVFDSMDALQTCAATPGAAKTFGHAREMSTGGAPLFLITAPPR